MPIRNNGFSLIEVTFALIIFSIGILSIVSISPTLSSSAHRNTIFTEEGMLIHHALSAMEMYATNHTWTEFQNQFDSYPTLSPHILYGFKVSALESLGAELDPYIRKATIEVRTPFRGDWMKRRFEVYVSR